jgi:hypothetical protein
MIRLNWEDVYARWGAQIYIWGELLERRDPSETLEGSRLGPIPLYSIAAAFATGRKMG